MKTKRLRIFAGPNGSGKTSLFDYLVTQGVFRKYYHINADELKQELSDGLDFTNRPFKFNADELRTYLIQSPLHNSLRQSLANTASDLIGLSEMVQIEYNSVFLKNTNSPGAVTYLCAALADYIREKMLRVDTSFSFETVFSHSSKVDIIKRAKDENFMVYLYFIATESPTINVERIKNRVKTGGHGVPEEKTRDRYYRSIEHLANAFKLVDRAYFFDNSGTGKTDSYHFFAEKRDKKLTIVNEAIPRWFTDSILTLVDKKT